MPSLRPSARPTRRPPPPRGAVLPFVLFTLTVLIGATALSLDLGRMRSVATETQDVADAAALGAVAAAQFNPTTAAQVGPQRAQILAAKNRAAGRPGSVAAGDVTPIVYSQSAGTSTATGWGNGVNAVVVTARATPTYALAGALGWARPTIARSATGWIGNMQGAACVRPMALPYTRIYEDINGLTSKPYSSQSPAAYAPTMTQAQVAQYAQLGVTARTFIAITPWQKESDWDTQGYANSGSWHTSNFANLGWQAYERNLGAPTGSATCAAATTAVASFLYPFVWTKTDPDTGGSPYGTAAGAAILDHNRAGFLTLCNQYGGGDTTNHLATCRNADGTVGVSTRVAFTDSIPQPGGTFSQRVRMVSQVRIMCYFVYQTDRCPATLISNGSGGQVAWSMPTGTVCTKYNNGNGQCAQWGKQVLDNGWPRGTMVVLLDAPVYGDITPDVTLGDSLSLTQRLVLVK